MARMEKGNRKTVSFWKTALPFERSNWILFGIGLVMLILGFLALSAGKWNSWMSLNVGPVILVLTYCVIFPLAILYKKRQKTE
ncbi:hypothetical protein KAR48_09385 [bacterium]|nr:hypothetical protein [bacterium]